MRSVTAATAAPCVMLLSVLLGSSSGVRAGDDFLLLVNPITGHAAMRSDFPSTVWINQYSIASPSGSLTPATWNSLDDQNAPPGTWAQTSATPTLVSESLASGETSFQNGTGFSLGQLFNFISGSQDLEFQYRLAGSATPSLGVVSYGLFSPPPNPTQVPFPEPSGCAWLAATAALLARRRRNRCAAS